jgi:hypothetical protein
VYYNFRIRVNRSDQSFIDSNLAEIRMPSAGLGFPVYLRSASQGKSIRDATQLVLTGEGFNSESDASGAGIRFEEAFMIALAKGRIGVDFGDRAPKSGFTELGLRSFFPPEPRSLSNVHGLMVYAAEPKPRFVAMGPPSLFRGITVQSFLDNFETAMLRKEKLTPREHVAFTLFNSSFFQPGADARFVLLLMAVEALIEPASISVEGVQYIQGFMKQIKESALPEDQKNSLLGRLGWLLGESISKAGQRLAREKLRDKTYEGKSGAEFFSYIYDLRSRLVHGQEPFPGFQEIHAMAAPLKLFVSDLLTAS